MIIGAGGHGKVAADIAKKCGYEEILFLDDNESVKQCGGYSVAGKCDRFSEYDCDFFVAVGNSKIREMLLARLANAGKHVPTLIHPYSSIGENVVIGEGTLVAAGAIINPGAVIGSGCILNTASSVDHDCTVESFVHISVGAHIAGTVHIGKHTWIGAGATVSNNVDICEDCMVGAGAVVVRDIKEKGTYIGVPAERMR